jgi:hypothetical protein
MRNKNLLIEARLGPLSWVNGSVVHPRGYVSADLRVEGGRAARAEAGVVMANVEFLRRLATRLSLAVWLLAWCCGAFGWSIGTHVYIVDRCLPWITNPNLKHQARYGAMLPDISASYVIGDRDRMPMIRDLMHVTGWESVVKCASGDRALEALAQGWSTHNQAWGADLYAHVAGALDPGPLGYVDTKGSVVPELPFSARHYYAETAIDMLVRRHLDPMLGRKVADAARYRDQRTAQLLANAYCPPLSATALIEAEHRYWYTTVVYGNLLSLPEPADRYAAASILAAQTEALTGHHVTL